MDRIREIFELVAGIPAEEREAEIVRLCAGDAALEREVRRLVELDAQASQYGFLAGDAVGRAAALSPTDVARPAPKQLDPRGLPTPDSIGPYRILGVLGEGGFGVVYAAERREPMVQRVAIKVIKPGMDSRAVLARFEQERQALAVMSHPNIARVLDAGVTEAVQGSRPYFVMEHVAGEPITEYCDRHNLTLRARLELFVRVCDAVQHAHHKGIIHRDIKPSNILVGEHEGGAAPKVIDFGIAKATAKTLTEMTVFTEAGQLIGTPEYMSPEQAQIGAVDIDTRTDVYSLGAVLYELLAGAVPFDPKSLRRAALGEFQRIIREEEPPKPSTRLTSLGAEDAAKVAKHRRLEREQLAGELRRELDWIPLKALRKERGERYATPKDLADDIGNYLAGRALEAGPVSAGYRVRKFVKRNRGPVVAGFVVAAALVLGVVGLSLGLWRASKAEEEQARLASANGALAAEKAALAESEAQRAREAEAATLAERAAVRRSDSTVSFLVDLMKAPSAEALGRDVLMRDALEYADMLIPIRASEDKELEARLWLSVAGASLGSGDRAAARRRSDQAQAALADVDPSRSIHLESLVFRSTLARAESQLDEGRRLAEEAWRQVQEAPDTPLALQASALASRRLAWASVQESPVGERDLLLLAAMKTVLGTREGTIYRTQAEWLLSTVHGGEPIETASFLDECLDVLTRANPTNLGVAALLVELRAGVAIRAGDYGTVVRLVSGLLQAPFAEVEGAAACLPCAEFMLASSLQRLGQLSDAKDHFERAVARYSAQYGAASIQALNAAKQMRGLLIQMEDWDALLRLARERAEVAKANFPVGAAVRGEAMYNLADALVRAGRWAEAERAADELARENELHYGRVENPFYGSSLHMRWRIAYGSRDFESAAAIAERLCEYNFRTAPSDAPYILSNLALTVDTYVELARVHDAVGMCLRVFDLPEQSAQGGARRRLESMRLAFPLRSRATPEVAVSVVERLRSLGESGAGGVPYDPMQAAEIELWLGSWLHVAGAIADAEEHLLAAERRSRDQQFEDLRRAAVAELVAAYEGWADRVPGRGYETRAEEWRAALHDINVHGARP